MREHDVPLVTDAAPSPDDELRARKRRYVVLMTIHLLGLAVGGALYQEAWGLGLAILIVTGPLQWVAVVLANDSRGRRERRRVDRPSRELPPHPAGTG